MPFCVPWHSSSWCCSLLTICVRHTSISLYIFISAFNEEFCLWVSIAKHQLQHIHSLRVRVYEMNNGFRQYDPEICKDSNTWSPPPTVLCVKSLAASYACCVEAAILHVLNMKLKKYSSMCGAFGINFDASLQCHKWKRELPGQVHSEQQEQVITWTEQMSHETAKADWHKQ